MGKETEIIRPFLFAVRLALLICAVIVLGLTAWSAERLKGYRVIFTLVIAVLTVAFYIPSLFTASSHRNRGFFLPLDIIFYALWLTALVFVTQTNKTLSNDNIGCDFYAWGLTNTCAKRNAIEAFTILSFFWTLCGLCLEILNIYFYGKLAAEAATVRHPEKPAEIVHDGPVPSAPSTNVGNSTVPSTEPNPAINGERAGV